MLGLLRSASTSSNDIPCLQCPLRKRTGAAYSTTTRMRVCFRNCESTRLTDLVSCALICAQYSQGSVRTNTASSFAANKGDPHVAYPVELILSRCKANHAFRKSVITRSHTFQTASSPSVGLHHNVYLLVQKRGAGRVMVVQHRAESSFLPCSTRSRLS